MGAVILMEFCSSHVEIMVIEKACSFTLVTSLIEHLVAKFPLSIILV